MKIDLGHWAVIVASILEIIGPDVLAHLTASEVTVISKVVGALAVVLSSVAGLLKPSVVTSINAAATESVTASGGKSVPVKLTMLSILLLGASQFEVAGCTPAEVKTAENAVFSIEQVACIAANADMFGTSTAVTDIEAACSIVQALEPSLVSVANSFAATNVAAKARAKK